MEREFVLSCCSTVDLPYAYMAQRDIPVLFYHYVVGNQEYVDDMGRDPAALPRFYGFLKAGQLPQTSQINVADYLDFFEEQLQKGDLLHIAFTSGQSGSVHNAQAAGKLLQEKYPDKKIVVIDSLCSSSGYGLLVDTAADMRDAGATLEETAQWVLRNRNKVHHQFFSSDMTQFRRTGRVSGAAAMVATIMNICPIMRLDDKGAIKAYSKVRGKKKAVEATVNAMEEHAQGGRDYDQRCFVCHSQCPEDAQMLIDALEERFPRLRGKIRLCDIGTIIGSQRPRHRGGVLHGRRAPGDGLIHHAPDAGIRETGACISACQKGLAEFAARRRQIKCDPFFAGACTWQKILLSLQVWNLFAHGGQIMRAADCKPFVQKGQRPFWIISDGRGFGPARFALHSPFPAVRCRNRREAASQSMMASAAST